MKNFFKNLKVSKIFDALVYVLLFLLAFHFFNLTGYFLIAFDLLVAIKVLLNKQARLTPQFCLIVLFSISFFTINTIQVGFELRDLIVYLFSPICLALYGQSLFLSANKEEKTKKVFGAIFALLLGIFAYVFVSLAFTISRTGLAFFSDRRVFYNVWNSEGVTSPTYFSLYADALFCFSLPVLFGKFKGKNVITNTFAILGIIFSIFGSLILSNRSFFVVVIVAIIIFGFLYLIPKFSHYINKLIAFFSVFTIFCIFVLLIVVFDIFDLKETLSSVYLFKRFFEGGSDASRWRLYQIFFAKFGEYPFGGMVNEISSITETEYVHNTFLDIYMLTGIIPFILYFIVFIRSLIGLLGLIGQKENLNYHVAVEMAFIGFIGVFLFEPVVQGDIYIFDFLFIFYGYFDLCYYEYYRGRVRKNYFENLRGKPLKIVFISNFISLHTESFHDEMIKKYGDNYCFISTENKPEEHISYNGNSKYSNVVCFEEEKDKAIKLLSDADVILYGNVDSTFINKFKRKHKIIINVAERLYKNGKYQYLTPHAFLSSFKNIRRFDHIPTFRFAMSGYAAYDASLYLNSPNRVYEWGYYPIDKVNTKIKPNKKLVITFIGRLIEYKNPFLPVKTALMLKDNNVEFVLNMIGNGEYKEELLDFVNKNNLKDYVNFYESISNEKVNDILYHSDILVQTANEEEGWGATINEGLAAGCLVLASYHAGASVYLINDGYNGILIDPDNDFDLFNKIYWSIENSDKALAIRKNAAENYLSLFSPCESVNRLDIFLKEVVDHGECKAFNFGPCSKCEIISDDNMKEYVKQKASNYNVPAKKENVEAKERTTFVSSALISYLTIAFNVVTALFYTPWMISVIGQSSYGLYQLTLSITAIITMNLGIGTVLARYISKYRAIGKEEEANKFTGIVFKIYTVLSLLALVGIGVVYLLIDKVYVGLLPSEIQTLKVIFVIVGLYSVIGFEFSPINGIFVGNEKYKELKIITLLKRMLEVVLVVVFLLLGTGLYGFVIISVATSLIEIVIKYFYIKKKRLAGYKPDFKFKDKDMTKSFLRFSGWTILIAVTSLILTSFNQTVLGIFSDSTQISIFAIASLFEGYAWTFSDAINGLFIPKLTFLDNEGNSAKKVEDLLLKIFRTQLFLVGFIIIGLFALGRGFINNVWKYDATVNFDPAYFCIIFLLLPGLFTYPNGVIVNLFYVRGKVKYYSICNVIAAIISLALSCLLSWKFPENAAICCAFSIFIGKFVGLVLLASIFEKNVLKLNMWRIIKEGFIPIILGLVIVFAVGFVSETFIETTNYFILFAKAFMMVVIYFGICYVFLLDKSEKKFITQIIEPISGLNGYENFKTAFDSIETRKDLSLSIKKSTKKHVYFINTVDFGAPFEACKKVMEELENEGFVVRFACRKTNNQNYYQITSNGIGPKISHILCRLNGSDGFHNETDTANLINDISEFKADVVVLNNLHGHFVDIELLFYYLRTNNIKVIYSIKDFWPLSGKCSVYNSECKCWEKGCKDCKFKEIYPQSLFKPNTAKMYDKKNRIFNSIENICFVANSDFTKFYFDKSYLKDKKCELIPEGIKIFDLKNIDIKDIRNKYSLHGEKIIFGLANNLNESKGIAYFNKLADELGDGYKIILAGHKVKEVKYNDKIIFVGFKNKHELLELYKACDVFVNPSLFESLGLTNIEGIAYAKKVVAFNTGVFFGKKSSKNVRICELGDYDSLKKNVVELANSSLTRDPELEKYLKLYDQDVMARKYVKLIKEIIENE